MYIFLLNIFIFNWRMIALKHHVVSCIQPGLVICFTLDNIRFDAVLLKHPTLAFSHRVQKTVLYIKRSDLVHWEDLEGSGGEGGGRGDRDGEHI